MNEITMFAMALLAVPVFARFARVKPEVRRIYHLIGLGGLFLLVGDGTRILATKVSFLGLVLPVMDPVTAILGYLSVLMGTLLVVAYFVHHWKEIHI